MILFIGSYPDLENEKDGMVQRVAFIDLVFKGWDRIYLDISFLRHRQLTRIAPTERLKVYKLNFFLHLLLILSIGLRAEFVYVHSVHNAALVLPLYFLKKVVTDLHGVVPEELAYQGKKILACIMGIVEVLVVKRSAVLITVTEAMADHLKAKYSRVPAIFTFPLVLKKDIKQNNGGTTDLLTVIYSGGIQKWQNLGQMFQVIKILKNKFNYIILSGNLEAMLDKMAAYGIEDNIEVKTVSYDEVFNYYSRAHMGFLLREDNVVNRVSCPTKLVEYLSCGVIPVILQPEIGDFSKLGYSYILVDELLAGKIPAHQEMLAMQQNNYRVIAELKRIFDKSVKDFFSQI